MRISSKVSDEAMQKLIELTNSRGDKVLVGSVSDAIQASRTTTLKPRNPESLTKDEIKYMRDSLADIKAGRYTISAQGETAEDLLKKLKTAHPESLKKPAGGWGLDYMLGRKKKVK